MMLDLFLKLIDRLIKLAEYRGKKREDLFTDLYEPIFRELENVHKDYLGMFSRTYHNLLSPRGKTLSVEERRSQLQMILDRIHEERIEYEPVRMKLWALVTELRKGTDSETANSFLLAVSSYVPQGSPTGRLMYSKSWQLVDFLILAIGSPEVDISRLKDSIAISLDQIRWDWIEVSSKFATLKAEVYGIHSK
ncbi:MAG: hypothetical protein K8R79_03330 [Calditrichales bacterium]|nr:hypothetical protein [Calditrichales bacterium]